MKSRLILVGMTLITGFLASGCANNRALIAKAALGDRQDAFTEAIGTEVQPGKATVDIKFSVKSNYSRFMWTDYKHTDPPYRVHLNVDGQVTTLEAEPVFEDNPAKSFDDPEGGTGWKYYFSKELVLAPGKHKLIVALPVDDVIVEQEIDLRNGANTIILKPVYKTTRLRPYKAQRFTAGVKAVEVQVN